MRIREKEDLKTGDRTQEMWIRMWIIIFRNDDQIKNTTTISTMASSTRIRS